MFNEVLQNQFWACEPVALQTFLDAVVQKNNPELLTGITLPEVATSTGKPYVIDDGIAVFEIFGTLLKRCSPILTALFGIRGTEQIDKDFSTAVSDNQVKGIFLHFDSPGGAADAFPALSDTIYNGRKIKPILSFIDGCGCSGASWLATSASFVALSSEIARTGSIGVLGVHFNVVDRAAQMGIKPTVFSSGRFKSIGTEFRELSETDCQYVQATFDQVHVEFLKGISRNMGMPVNKMDGDLKEAKVFMGSQAVAVGLADAVMNREKAMAKLRQMAGLLPGITSKSVATKTEGKAQNMRFANSTLIDFVREIKKTGTTEDLSKVEPDILAETQDRKEKAKNHLERTEAETLERNCRSIIDGHRRFLLSLPGFKKDKAQYELGRTIAMKK